MSFKCLPLGVINENRREILQGKVDIDPAVV